ncbi:TonB-dependent receptor [Thalassomonas viridans]|uniref:TonB-dependent receptor n=1 Tax=Thalassomonas viridans TaxID=137584 RepID=A0AAF0CDD1_9GAMM|nr:TonB-dependent receptor [Thalassomonas viridans]WDE09073.1 TonB-dependent receptor [Thalassomonas viridans]
MNKTKLSALVLLAIGDAVQAHERNKQAEVEEHENIIVYGRQMDQFGETISISQGSISQGEIEQRPVLRSGEILEFVPGMVVTQHSGSGKANQYFLRGFNLDHGTDFKTTIDNMPVNMRTHGHGQGYTDLSFITPEFVQRIDYQKGPYHAEDGDFSTAGSANFVVADVFNKSLIQLEAGEDNYFRSVFAHNIRLGDNNLLLGWEHHKYHGPWTDINEDAGKDNLLIKYAGKNNQARYSVTFMGYDNEWNAADQIPDRAVKQGLIDALGSLDTGTGGEVSRYSLSFQYDNGDWMLDGYTITSKLDLFSNFTYFLDDPVNGDQFQQVDDRKIYGGQLGRRFDTAQGNNHIHHNVGVQVRYDDIDTVGLYKTVNRQQIATTRQDSVEEYSISLFWEGEMDLTNALSVNLGARYDFLDVDVDSNVQVNSGTDNDGLFSLKGGLQYLVDNSWMGYFNIGQSFHSNDARGATITVDPNNGEAADPVDLMVRGEGAELGLRFIDTGRMNLSFGLWILELDSELLFVGDAGNTEAGRASRRKGVEFTGYYWFDDAFSADLELAWSRARFTQDAIGEGDRVEGALPFVASLGLTWSPNQHWRTSFRLRHFGKRTLDSFDQMKSGTFTVANASVTYSVGKWQADIEVLNLFDSKDHDIDYFYESRLADEPAEGIEDNHYHPIEPRTMRFQLRYTF